MFSVLNRNEGAVSVPVLCEDTFLFPQTRFLQAASVRDRLPLLADLVKPRIRRAQSTAWW